MSWSGVIRDIVLWSSVDAASSMPCDSMPLSVLGARFAMMIIFLPWSCSFVYCSFMPAHIVLVSSPRDIVSLYNLSAIRLKVLGFPSLSRP